MIGIADPKLWNLGVGILSKWNGLTFFLFFDFVYDMGKMKKKMKYEILIRIFFCFTPPNSSSARLGQNSRASKVLVVAYQKCVPHH